MLQKFGGGMASLAPPGYAYVREQRAIFHNVCSNLPVAAKQQAATW